MTPLQRFVVVGDGQIAPEWPEAEAERNRFVLAEDVDRLVTELQAHCDLVDGERAKAMKTLGYAYDEGNRLKVQLALLQTHYESASNLVRLQAETVVDLERQLAEVKAALQAKLVEYEAQPIDLSQVRAETLAENTKEELYDICLMFMKKNRVVQEEVKFLEQIVCDINTRLFGTSLIEHEAVIERLRQLLSAEVGIERSTKLEAAIRQLIAMLFYNQRQSVRSLLCSVEFKTIQRLLGGEVT